MQTEQPPQSQPTTNSNSPLLSFLQPTLFTQQLQLHSPTAPPLNPFQMQPQQSLNDSMMMQTLHYQTSSLSNPSHSLMTRPQQQPLHRNTSHSLNMNGLNSLNSHNSNGLSVNVMSNHGMQVQHAPQTMQQAQAHAELQAQLKSQKLAIDIHLQSLQADRQKYLKIEENCQLRRQLQTQVKQLRLFIQSAEGNPQATHQQQYLKILQTQLDELCEFNILCVMTSSESQKDVEISIKSTLLSNTGLVLMPTFRRKPFASHVC